MIEVESKWTISQRGYYQLMSWCSHVKSIDQLNVYFDEQWTLADAGATCRIRCAPHLRPMFTLKLPVSWDKGGTRRSIEIESPVQVAFTNFSLFVLAFNSAHLNSEVRNALHQLNVSTLRRVGRMRNIRHVLALPSGDHFELDKFTLPGREVVYEVEIEDVDDDRRASIVSAICDLDPSAFPSRLSKFQRFTEAARRLGHNALHGGISAAAS